ncbi:myelin-oligodendrocyte glycoprotein-like [Poecilia latipinna]|uniref:myelin-oligodendrocyte glycoprotein-like n=1 Tax=Poecilia latipinna TaxID=48699 RepID=UPI00072E729E|nr:PREDICTED: myelin-oligodendrocyte glycoprotein-like [Poecilia latipinna]
MSEAAGLCEIFFSRSGFWTFIFFLVLFWTPVKGGLQLIGSSQPIVAAPGDDVILPCRVDPEWDAVGKTVEWSRPDLRPTGPQKRVEYVFVYRFRKTDRDMMMDTYIQRTSLSQDGLRRGDVSLTIRNVSLQDQGRFRCFIPRLGIEAELLLVVDPNFVSTTTTEMVRHRNLITPTPQEETSRNGHRSRMFLLIPIILFIISMSLLFILVIFSLKKCSTITKFQQNLLSRASASQFGCFGPEQSCDDVDQKSSQTLIDIPDQPQHHGNCGG